MGLGEYVQVFRGMFVKLGITGKESSVFSSFTFPFGEGKRGPQWLKAKVAYCLFLFSRWGSLCGGTPKIIKILVVVPQIIDGVPTPTPPGIFSWKSP